MLTTTTARQRRPFGLGRATIGLVSAAVLLIACGSDDNASDTTAAETTAAPAETAAAPETTAAPDTTAPADTQPPATEAPTTEPAGPTGSPVLVAAVTDQSGPSSGSQAYAADILNAWADHVNAAGGINGHPVTIEVRDTKGDPAAAQAALDELIGMKPALLYIADATSESSLAPSIEASGIPLVGVGYNPAVWGGNIEAFKLACSLDAGAPVASALPNAFTITTTFGAVVDEQVIAAQLAGATTLATAACAEVDSCSSAAAVFAGTAGALGLTDTGVTKVSSIAPDYSAECIKWVQDGVDFIQISGSGAMGARIFSDCTDQGYDGLFGASAGSVSVTSSRPRASTSSAASMRSRGGSTTHPSQSSVTRWRRPGLPRRRLDPNATGTWSVMQLWAKAMSNTDITADDEITKEASLASMYTLKDETLDGLISPVTFTEGERASHRPCFWPYELVDGEFTALNGGLEYSCNPPEA